MNKAFVDSVISNIRKANLVTKVSPWMVEGMGEKAMNVRYVGLKVNNEWNEVFSKANNVLLKFVIDRTTARLELYIANTPPFFLVLSKNFTENDKWESLLGDMRSRLKKDKADYLNHTSKVGNLYVIMKPHLR